MLFSVESVFNVGLFDWFKSFGLLGEVLVDFFEASITNGLSAEMN